MNDELDQFYAHMENKILEMQPIPVSYEKDKIFINTTKFQKGAIDLPFWWHLRKVPMSDDTLNALSERADISRETLLRIQNQGFTLVRTDDINKRTSLTLILDEQRNHFIISIGASITPSCKTGKQHFRQVRSSL